MRYKVLGIKDAWFLWDTLSKRDVLIVHNSFPDAEYLIRSQALFLNESPEMKEAA
jgi:hypothetical protein